jgi:CheY-like chemotaxis protein
VQRVKPFSFQFSIVTSAPIGVSGQTWAAQLSERSRQTEALRCSEEKRVKAGQYEDPGVVTSGAGPWRALDRLGFHGPDRVTAWMRAMERERSASCTVMVVDDEPDIRFLLRIALEGAGYGVVEAPHGEAALALVRRSLPQLVLTDWMMPRMNGGELIEQLRADESTKAIPIVIISGTRCDQAGADAVVRKPFDPGELIVLVDTLIGKER